MIMGEKGDEKMGEKKKIVKTPSVLRVLENAVG